MALLSLLIVVGLVALALWIAGKSKARRHDAEVNEHPKDVQRTPLGAQETPGIPAPPATAPASEPEQRIRDALASGRLSPQQALRIVDRANDLRLPKDLCRALSLLARRDLPKGITRCAVCGAPAIPGDDMCPAHHAR